MRTLIFSLLLAVMCSYVLAGYLVDRVYTTIYPEQISEAQERQELVQLAGHALAKAVNEQENKQVFIDNREAQAGLSLKLLDASAVNFPEVLSAKLKAGEALAIDGEKGPQIYYYLASSEQLLVIKSNVISSHKNEVIRGVLTIGFYLGVSFLLMLWIYPLVKRLTLLRQAAIDFGKGNLTTRIHVGKASAIKDLEVEFNRMATQIDSLLTDIKLLSGGVSHDLKTSLARLRFGIDAMTDLDAQAPSKYLVRFSDDTDEMIRLVDMMLEYARLDLAPYELTSSQVELDDLASLCLKKFSAHPIQIELVCKLSTSLIYGNQILLEMLLNNLLSNALQYAKSRVQVMIYADKEKLILEVVDDGIGVDDSFKADIFKPFFRLPDKAKSSEESGLAVQKHYGFGLAICQRIMEAHSGSLACLDSNGVEHLNGSPFDAGACMRASFPKTSA